MAAIMNVDPSLLNFIGGYGRAMGAIGKSMTDINQAKLDLEQQDRDNTNKNAYLDLQKSYYNDAKAAKEEAKQQKFDSNVATNEYLYRAMGKDVPGEMTNERAQLGNLDPSVVASTMKVDAKERYAATDGGLIYDKLTGQMVNDYRDKNSSKGVTGLPYMEGMIGGKMVRTYFDPATGKAKLNLTAPGKPYGIYSQDYADSIGDTNTGQRPVIKNDTDQGISAGNAIQSGGLPVRLSSDPKVAKAQKDYLYPTAGGGWYVPANLVSQYKKQFPQ